MTTPDTELKWHLLNDHKNDAAGNLTDEDAVRQHFDEHHGPGGLRNHVDPPELHSWEVTRDPKTRELRYSAEPSAAWDEEPELPREVVIATHGPVIVNWVGRVLRRRGVRIYEADLRTKYVEVKGYSTGGGTVDVLLGTTPESLHVAPGTGFTVMTLRPGRGDWNIAAQCARYTLYVCLWRDPRPRSGRGPFDLWRSLR